MFSCLKSRFCKQSWSNLREENRLLRQKIGWLIKRYFGGNQSERIDPGQLELLLAGLEQAEENKPAEQTAEPPPEPKARKGAGARRQRLPEHLEVEEIVIEPEAVKVEPQKWRLIGEEVTEELDLLPARFIRRRKYVSREKPQEPPVLAPLPSRLIEKGIPGVGLLVHILLSKYVDHLPLYRQEKIFRERYGVRVARQSMLDWIHQVAQWLKPIYNYMCLQLFEGGYIQADETPIRYLDPDAGKKEGCRKGYLWVYGRPGGEVLYDWHTGRGVNVSSSSSTDTKGCSKPTVTQPMAVSPGSITGLPCLGAGHTCDANLWRRWMRIRSWPAGWCGRSTISTETSAICANSGPVPPCAKPTGKAMVG